MKRALAVCLAALLALAMCGCTKSWSTTYTVTRNGVEYTVDQENCTIFDGTNTYQYTFSGNASSYSVNITYPDGSTYSWSRQTNSNGIGFGTGGWSDDYDEGRYVSGDVLCDIIEKGAPAAPKKHSPGMVLLAIVMIGGGLFNIAFPQAAWYLSDGWKFRDAEPSDAALGLARFGGAAAIVIGVIMLLAS